MVVSLNALMDALLDPIVDVSFVYLGSTLQYSALLSACTFANKTFCPPNVFSTNQKCIKIVGAAGWGADDAPLDSLF